MPTLMRYPGSKLKKAKALGAYFTKSHIYCEPFVGAGSTFLYALDSGLFEKFIINDADANIFYLWDTLNKNNAMALMEKIVNYCPDVESFKKLKDSNPVDPIGAAFRKLVLHQCSYSGLGNGPIGGWKQQGSWKIDCRWNTDMLLNKLHNIQSKMLGHNIEVFNTDWMGVIDSGGFYYIDPPYYEAGDILYDISMTHQEHQGLSDVLRTKSNWVLSYNNHPVVKSLYSWANISKLEFSYTANKKHKIDELIIRPCHVG